MPACSEVPHASTRIACRSASSRVAQAELGKADAAVDEPALERAGDGRGLLVDLLEHEGRESRRGRPPPGRRRSSAARAPPGARASKISTPSARSATSSPSSTSSSWSVVSANAEIAEAMNCSPSPAPITSGASRRAPTRSAGLVGAHRDEREVAVQLGVGGADGVHEVALVQRADELRDGLGVGLGGELAGRRPRAPRAARRGSRRCR